MNIDQAVDRILRESNVRLFGTNDYDDLMEVWSDAARAAAIAARKARAGGKDWRQAARKEYGSYKSGMDLGFPGAGDTKGVKRQERDAQKFANQRNRRAVGRMVDKAARKAAAKTGDPAGALAAFNKRTPQGRMSRMKRATAAGVKDTPSKISGGGSPDQRTPQGKMARMRRMMQMGIS